MAAFKQQRIELGFVGVLALFNAAVPGRAFAVIVVDGAAHRGPDAGFIGVRAGAFIEEIECVGQLPPEAKTLPGVVVQIHIDVDPHEVIGVFFLEGCVVKLAEVMEHLQAISLPVAIVGVERLGPRGINLFP